MKGMSKAIHVMVSLTRLTAGSTMQMRTAKRKASDKKSRNSKKWL
jgi:hypothetical protein